MFRRRQRHLCTMPPGKLPLSLERLNKKQTTVKHRLQSATVACKLITDSTKRWKILTYCTVYLHLKSASFLNCAAENKNYVCESTRQENDNTNDAERTAAASGKFTVMVANDTLTPPKAKTSQQRRRHFQVSATTRNKYRVWVPPGICQDWLSRVGSTIVLSNWRTDHAIKTISLRDIAMAIWTYDCEPSLRSPFDRVQLSALSRQNSASRLMRQAAGCRCDRLQNTVCAGIWVVICFTICGFRTQQLIVDWRVRCGANRLCRQHVIS